MIAPDHGVVWRKDPGKIIDAYSRWCVHEGRGHALVIYDTMWHSTEIMAKAVADGLMDEGISCKLLDLRVNHRSDVMTDVLDASAIILGCPTLNNGMLPRMAGFLMYMRGLKPTNKIGAAFGSYGWSGEAVRLMNEAMAEMKFTIVHEGLRVQYVPEHPELAQCVELGRTVGRSLKDVLSGREIASVI